MHSETSSLLKDGFIDSSSSSKNKQKFKAGLTLLLASSLLVAGGWFYRQGSIEETRQSPSQVIDFISKKEFQSSDSENGSDDGYTEAALADEITMLPGIDVSTLNFRQFSGYLNANDDRQLFYWFVESQKNPESDPLVMWTNGGPGCSSLLGLLSEHGPFWVDPNLQLYANDYAWNKEVNIFYIEQPYGVGYSTTDEDNYVIGDKNASLDMDTAIRSFLTKFPKFKEQPFSISGESYAGHYLPTLALTILTNNDAGYSPHINFKGLLVGNPYTDYYSNSYGFIKALYGHGIVSDYVMSAWDANCHSLEEESLNPICEKAYVDAYENAGDINFYAMDYDECTFNNLRKRSMRGHMHTGMMKKRVEKVLSSKMLSTEEEKHYGEVLKKHSLNDDSTPYWPCIGEYMTTYLNLANVQQALHVKQTDDGETLEWDECDYDIFYNWPDSDWLTGMEATYQTLVDDYDISIMIYSGDDDSVCSTQGTQFWLNKMQWKPVVQWEVWEDENHQVGGYYTAYAQSEEPRLPLPPAFGGSSSSDSASAEGTTEEATKTKLTVHYYTVRSSGHMVPTTTPGRGLAILQFYLDLPGVATK